MLLAVVDTETTGIIGKDYMKVDNPHIASITAIIYNTDTSRVQASFNTMILPDDWEMPPGAEAVNGLATETLLTYGIPIKDAMKIVSLLLEPADLFIAHNDIFDIRMVASELYRNDLLDELDVLLGKESYCTMKESKHIVQAKNKNGGLKNPKLTEAYEFFFEKQLDNSHSANADTVACLEIYLALQQYKEVGISTEDEDEISL